tara:strand:- start:4459 stop:4731 length:273 start_codon:yes stop_codon:yes gene_type:complete
MTNALFDYFDLSGFDTDENRVHYIFEQLPPKERRSLRTIVELMPSVALEDYLSERLPESMMAKLAQRISQDDRYELQAQLEIWAGLDGNS